VEGEPDWEVRITPRGDGRWDYELSTPTPNDLCAPWKYWGAILGIRGDDLHGVAKNTNKAQRKAEAVIWDVKRAWANLQRGSAVVDANLVLHWDGNPSQ
jgi:hypothetical protein